MDAYFGFGTYSLFNCVNLKICENADRPGILFMFDTVLQSKLIHNQLVNSKLFEDVILLEMNDYELYRPPYWNKRVTANELKKHYTKLQFRRLFRNRFPQIKYYDKYPFGNQFFERIFTLGFHYYLEEFYLWQYYHGSKIYCYEHGISARYVNFGDLNRKKTLKKLLGYHDFYDILEAFYMYNPEMCIGKYRKPLIRQKSPNQFTASQKDKFKSVWAYVNNSCNKYPEKALFFAQACKSAEDDFKIKGYANVENEIINKIKTLYNDGDFMVKPHPYGLNLYNEKVYNSDIPIEVSMFYQGQNVENMTFISCYSNSLYIAKYLYDLEPRIVFLYKLLGARWQDEEQQDYIVNNLLRNHYRDSSKVIVPKSFEELEAFLKS